MLKVTLLSMRSLNWKGALKKIRWIGVVLIIGLPIMAHEVYATMVYSRQPIIVYSLVIQPDGKILVGGMAPESVDSHNFLVRLNADGSLDTTFERNMSGRVEDIVVQADSKILVGWNNYPDCYELVRLNPDGSTDKTFNPESHIARSIAVQADGKILVGGNVIGGQRDIAIHRLNADGSMDKTFRAVLGPDETPGHNYVRAIVVQANGKILIGGKFGTINGQPRANIGRLHRDGSLDMAFNPDADNSVGAVVVQSNGKILVSGAYTHLGGQVCNFIGRLDADGGLDLTFDSVSVGEAFSMDIQADGKILVGGMFNMLRNDTLGDDSRYHIGRLNVDGSVDMTFNMSARSRVYAIAGQVDGKVLVGGPFTMLDGITKGHRVLGLARLNADGSLDTTFKPWTDNLIKPLSSSILLMRPWVAVPQTTIGNWSRKMNMSFMLAEISVR